MINIDTSINQLINTPQLPVRNTLPSSGLRPADLNDIWSVSGFSDNTNSAVSSEPALSSPAGGLSVTTTNDTTRILTDMAEDTVSLNMIEKALIEEASERIQYCMEEEQAKNKAFFDISNMSSGAVSLLVAASMLMLSLNQADTALAGKLSLVSFDAARNTADSIKREGVDMLTGNISQSVLQLGLTGVGAKFSLKGLKNEKLALRQGTDVTAITNNLSLSARRQEMIGDAISRNSMMVGSIAESSGQYASILERSEQQISQASTQVAGTASENAREDASQVSNLIQEILKIMESTSQSKMSTMAAVAGNMRA